MARPSSAPRCPHGERSTANSLQTAPPWPRAGRDGGLGGHRCSSGDGVPRPPGERGQHHRQRGRRRRRSGAPPCCTLPSAHPPLPGHPEPRRLTAEQQAFALSHLGLARQQARRFAIRHQLDYDELLGAAYEGLCKAALGFDPALGHQPSSYVVPKVKGELLHHLRDTGFALRICHRYRELWIKARRLVALGLEDEQIADALRVPVGVWVDVRVACGVVPVVWGEGVEGVVEVEG